jgi:hypothetical protein
VWCGRTRIAIARRRSECNEVIVTFRIGLYALVCLAKELSRGRRDRLAKDGVDAQVGDVFFVVEGADVGGHECFDAVSESSCGFGEGHPGA